MKPVIVAPLVALALAGAAAGGYFWLSSGGGVEEAVVAQPTATPTPTPGQATPPASPTPTPAAQPSPAPVPAGWPVYVDPVLGFSLPYPPELSPTDLTGAVAVCCPSARVIDFRQSGAKAQAVAVAIEDNQRSLSPLEWARENRACHLDAPYEVQEVVIGGRPGLICVAEPLDQQFELAAIVEDSGKVFYITATLTDADFKALLGGFSFS